MKKSFNRRSFLSSAGLSTLAVVYGSQALAQTEEVPMCPPPPAPPSLHFEISRNHGHVLVLSYEEVIAGEPKTYSIQGKSGHPHHITLEALHFEALRKVGAIEIESDLVAGHTHIVKIIRDRIP